MDFGPDPPESLGNSRSCRYALSLKLLPDERLSRRFREIVFEPFLTTSFMRSGVTGTLPDAMNRWHSRCLLPARFPRAKSPQNGLLANRYTDKRTDLSGSKCRLRLDVQARGPTLASP